jgi:hypothetical protein
VNMFVRESEGVYLFGNKKIYIKGFAWILMNIVE